MPDLPSEILVVTVAKFAFGRLVATPGVLAVVPEEEIQKALNRHIVGDWGSLDDHDRKANDQALEEGSRLLSAYETKLGIKFWIITEHDRSVTTVLLPEEY